MLACSLGHAASRDTKAGTLFVRSIYDVFREHAKTNDILALMTLVLYSEFAFYYLANTKRVEAHAVQLELFFDTTITGKRQDA